MMMDTAYTFTKVFVVDPACPAVAALLLCAAPAGGHVLAQFYPQNK